MAQKDRTALKGTFITDYVPTQADFGDVFDSMALVGEVGDKLDASAVSTFGGTLIDDADAATARTTLGLGSAATADATSFASAGHTHTIAALSNVTITTPTDNALLAYDSATAKWINQTAAGAGLATAAQGTLAESAVQSDTAQAGGGSVLDNMVRVTQAEYDAIATKDATTLYVIEG